MFFVPNSIFFSDKPIVKTYQVINVLKVLQRQHQYPTSIFFGCHSGRTFPNLSFIDYWTETQRPDSELTKPLGLVKTWPKPSQTSDQLQLVMSCPSNGGQLGELSAELSVCVGHWRSERRANYCHRQMLKQKHTAPSTQSPRNQPVSSNCRAAEMQSQQFETCRSSPTCTACWQAK